MLLKLTALLIHVYGALANTEKVIFLGPESLSIPIEHPTLEDLHLHVLSPQQPSLRTHIQSEFPSNISQYGYSSWILLTELQVGQRYEVRICWAATEPTSFRLDTYSLPEVLENPKLITSLAAYSESRQPDIDSQPSGQEVKLRRRKEVNVSSNLLLQIQTAADYYTMNQTLMKDAPPVFVDVILDPFIFNAVPKSLLPTAAYIVFLAIAAWQLSTHVSNWIGAIAVGDRLNKKKIV